MSPSTPRVLSRRSIFEGRIVRLATEEVELPGGRRTTLELIEHPGAVVVVPVTAGGDVVLIRQYRHAARRSWLLELPAGTLEPDEAIEDAARRECEEEIGLVPGRLDRLGGIWTTPGFTDEWIELFLARDLAPGRRDLDDDESIEIVEMPFGEALALALDGGLDDAKSVAALVRAAAYLDASSASSDLASSSGPAGSSAGASGSSGSNSSRVP